MNRKGFQLSITMIVVVILAVITLILAVGFITGTFEKIRGSIEDFPILQIQPTSTDPISFIPANLQRGKENKLTLGFYNDEGANIGEDVKPTITCEGISEVLVKAAGQSIAVGSIGTYFTIVTIPNDTPKASFPCTLKISETSRQFFLDVN